MKNKNVANKVDEMMKIALASEEEPGEELNRRIIQSWKEQNNMKRQTVKRIYAVAAACGALMVTVSAGAAVKYLNPADAAAKSAIEAQRVEAAFQSKDAIEINESKEAGDYRFTLLGITTEQGLAASQFAGEVDKKGEIYAIVAVERMDGTPMPDISDAAYDDLAFFMTPLVDGLAPWEYNTASMGGGYSDFVENGIMYRVIASDDITMFADKDLHLGISDTSFYDTSAFNYDDASGKISRNENYDGINVLFDLPVDESRADQEKAAEYLKTLESDLSTQEAVVLDAEEETVDALINEIDQQIRNGEEEKALQDAKLLEDQTKTVTGKDGYYNYSCSFGDEGESSMTFCEDNFTNGKDVMVFNGDSEGKAGIYISVLTDNGDGTAVVKTYYKAL